MKRRKISKNVTFLKGALIVLCFVAVVIFWFYKRIPEQSLSWNFNDLAELIQIFILSITAYIALNVYASNAEIEELKMLIKLRELLSSGKNHKIHQRLEAMSGSNTGSGVNFDEEEEEVEEEEEEEETGTDAYLDGSNNCDVFNYLGTLELCKIILEHDVISTASFRNQFGYRVENVVNCPSIVKCMSKDKSYWTDFFELLNFFPDYKVTYNNTKNRKEK